MNNPYESPPRGGQFDQEQQYATYGESKPKNILGIVGFIFSVTCLLAPLGLLLSVIALLKRPKGFAIAGTIIGLLFSIPHGFIVYSGYQWSTMSPGEIVAASTSTETGTVIFAVEQHIARTGTAPASLDEVDLSEASRTDFWGTPYRYESGSSGGKAWRLSSAGPDGEFGTADDLNDLVDFTSDKSLQQAFISSFEQSIDVDQFDREAAKDELRESTIEMFRTLMGNPTVSPDGNDAETPSDDSSADPEDDPDSPDTP
jgi:hypothetical protein